MTMMRVALGLLLLSAPITANAQAKPDANSRSAKAPAAKAKTYCVEYKLLTGSRIATKECNTREGWAKQGIDVDQLGKD